MTTKLVPSLARLFEREGGAQNIILEAAGDMEKLLCQVPGECKPLHTCGSCGYDYLAVDGLSLQEVKEVCGCPVVLRAHWNSPVEDAGLLFRKDFIPIGTEDVWSHSGGEAAEKMGVDGSESTVAVVDTGAMMAHRNFMRNGFEFAGDRVGSDPSGHGTFTAAAINSQRKLSPFGVYCRGMSKAKVVAVRGLYGFHGSASVFDVLSAMDTASAREDVDIVSMSLGGQPLEAPAIDPLARMVKRIIDRGKVAVVARGNNPSDYMTPGISERAIVVGSWSMTDDAPAWFSREIAGRPRLTWSFGGGRKQKDLEPNEMVVGPTSLVGSLRRWTKSAGILPRGRYGGFSGSSMSTPVVSGIVALWNSVGLKRRGRKMTHGEVKALTDAHPNKTVCFKWAL